MANTSFYRLKFKTIDFMTNYWVCGQLLIWWLAIDLYAGQSLIANIKIWIDSPHESCENLSLLSNKKWMSSFGLLKPEI
jgi:hypothetical protein